MTSAEIALDAGDDAPLIIRGCVLPQVGRARWEGFIGPFSCSVTKFLELDRRHLWSVILGERQEHSCRDLQEAQELLESWIDQWHSTYRGAR